jgi:AcrR family transcriptional regulator
MKRKPRLQPRKTPQQARAAQMNEDILTAATRILRRHGAAEFTTNKVAEQAGISIGSLYQYYPNKAAILFRLQEREMEATWQSLEAILSDESQSPRARIRQAVQYFFVSEAQEAEMRAALSDAAVYFRESKEFKALEAHILTRMQHHLRLFLPKGQRDEEFAIELFLTTVSTIAERVTVKRRDESTLTQWATAVGEMLCNHLGIADETHAPGI